MIDFDEIVETSDVEELEEIAAQKAYVPRIRRSSELGTGRFTESPRKKIKVRMLPTRHTILIPDTQQLSPELHDEVIVLLQPSQKFAGTHVLTPRKSQASSPLVTTSSPVQTQASGSLPRTPDSVHIPSIFKSEEDEIGMALDSVEPDYSQDPLLLCSPPKSPSISRTNSDYEPLSFPSTPLMTSKGEVGHSNTPKESPPGAHPPSSLFDLLFPDAPVLSLPSPYVRPMTPEPSSHNPTQRGNDDLSLFTPVKPLSQLFSSSPLAPSNLQYEDRSMGDATPEARRSQSGSRSRSSSKSPSPENILTAASPSPETPHVNMEEDHRLAMDLAENDPAQTTRYSLRTRKLHQKMPFTADQIAYHRQLRENPEAIVKFKALNHRHRHHHPDDHYEEPDTQQDDEDAEWERKERRRQQREEQRRAETAQRSESEERNHRHYPGLEEMSSTDEDERRAMDETAKEAKRLVRKMAQQRKAEEKAERERRKEEQQRKVKRFPMPKKTSVPPQSRSSKSAESPSPSDQSNEVRDPM